MRIHGRCTAALVTLVVLAVSACGGDSGLDEQIPDEEHDEGVVTLSQAQLESAGIETAVVEWRQITDVMDAAAAVEAAADRVARLGSRVSGRIVEVPVIEGDSVRSGAIVAIVDSPDLGRAKADYLASLASAEVTQEISEREAELFRDRITSEQEWRRAQAEAIRANADKEAAENRLHALGLTDADLLTLAAEGHYTSRLDIRTPIGGIVVNRQAALGEMIEPTDVLVTVMDLREVWVLIDVYDEQLSRVEAGQNVVARTRAYPDRIFEGRIDNIGAVIEPTTRAVSVRVVIPNPDGALKPGMFADVQIQAEVLGAEPVLAIPGSAIQRDSGELIVFVREAPTTFERRVVTLEGEPGAWAAIRTGLIEGDEVVIAGAFVLKSELGKGDLGENEH